MSRRVFFVIDTTTGHEADIERIAMTEQWADKLMYCDMEGWLLGERGELCLADECGCYAYPPDQERFKIVFVTNDEARP